MLTLIFLFLVMVGLIVFLTIFDAITSIFNGRSSLEVSLDTSSRSGSTSVRTTSE